MRFIISYCLALLMCFCAGKSMANEANLYNPYIHKRLPSQELSNDASKMAKSIGAKKSNLQDEATHRTFWRNEVYPVVFGNAVSKNEIIAFLDYAKPTSEAIWAEIVKATKSLDLQNNKVVVFAKNSEQYGTELMGGGIWISYSRPQYTMDFFSYSLRRWNETKRSLAAKGIKRPFVYEYDATVTNKDYPILYSYLSMLKPALTTADYKNATKNAFDAGNINAYQAHLAAKDYDVEEFPAVVVNGEVLAKVSAQAIIKALQ